MYCLALGPKKAAFPAEPGRERRPVRRSYGSLVRNLVVRGLLLSDDALRLRRAYDPPKSRRKGETQTLNIKVWIATLAAWMTVLARGQAAGVRRAAIGA
jgi:hypothetical protein